jgi:hypothetical protein
MNSINNIIGRSNARNDNSIPIIINRGKSTTNSNVVPIKLARLLDNTRSHRGRYTLVTKGAFPSIEPRDIVVPIEKNLQTRRAVRRKTGKFWTPERTRVENTKVSISIIARGLSNDQKNPKTELRYLSLNSLIAKFLMSSPYSSNKFTPYIKVFCRLVHIFNQYTFDLYNVF